ncbi:MAG: hypothetical protein AAGU76_17455 [Sedimentibacter sp.]|uniref:hypothetical protein n=1 Tax=Sedimentibacter sp. TaxID=1960295 RepID=UPI00315924B3
MNDLYEEFVKAAFKNTELTEYEKKTIIRLYEQEGQKNIYEFSKNKKILPFAAALMSQFDTDSRFWDDITLEYKKRNEEIIRCLDAVFKKMEERFVNKIFVSENFGALLLSDSDKSLFASGDVDIYADISQKSEIYESFRELGYKIKERYTQNKLINSSFHNEACLPKEFYFSVCWYPLSRIKLPCFVTADEFIEWGKLLSYRSTAIKLADIESAMYICLMHISLHSFSRAPDIRLYIDIKNISSLSVNWEKICGFAKRDGTMVRLLTACILSKKLIEADIPDAILDYRKHYEKQISRILKIVYDSESNSLLYEPRGLKVLLIEANSNDTGFFYGILDILLPNRNWLREVYCKNDSNILWGYIKHIRNLLEGG